MTLFDAYASVKNEADAAARGAGRDPAEVRLLAVSKFFPASAVAELYACGVRCFGESREPELEIKAAALPRDIEWHFIGALQSNKVRKVVKLAAYLHAVDSVKLVERIDRIAGEENRAPRFFLEVNLSGEASKSGVAEAELAELAAAADACAVARCVGLMTMAREGADGAELCRCFGRLRTLRDELNTRLHRPLAELSMGMSGDFPTAIACGATTIRIGSRIFGVRNYGTRD